ncbi:hypothetical protein [Corynebacterium diphtheriae]|uniref:hypothetical protein n=1 Tax=Corynebacterium diphtheriae TaxID=1717 RepID=UPI0013CB9999|nr:hypothetical protein [Corynebacterium diphtheriae]CAB0629763.1 hypothetical protein CIP107576_00276 [Corynebacterium diphtheriae]CAB0629872.1 hypothetical protein CIP107560_00277 [Corynebacterium diphtheriae]
MERIELWIRKTVGNASDREIGKLANIGQSTLSRQRRDGTVTVETAVKIARAYQVSVVPALLALDVLTEFDLKAFSTSSGIMDASDEDLVAEILRRMKAGKPTGRRNQSASWTPVAKQNAATTPPPHPRMSLSLTTMPSSTASTPEQSQLQRKRPPTHSKKTTPRSTS